MGMEKFVELNLGFEKEERKKKILGKLVDKYDTIRRINIKIEFLN